MKFTCFVDINLSRERVVELFDNAENLKEWQDGFVSFDHISGTPGEAGAKSRMFYKMGKREMELIETILSNNLPEEFTGQYEAKAMSNTMSNRFIVLDANKTRYEADIEYTRFSGFLPKLFAFLMPGMFKKQVQKWMNQFRDFAERSGEA